MGHPVVGGSTSLYQRDLYQHVATVGLAADVRSIEGDLYIVVEERRLL